MTTDRDVHSKVIAWIALRTPGDIPVIKGDQNGDQPVGPFIMVRFTGSDEVRDHPSTIDYTEAGDDISAAPVIEVEWRYSVHAFNMSDPTNVLRPLRSAVHLAQTNEPLMPELVVHEVSQIRNVPELVGERIEQRAQMDLFVRGLTKDGFLINSIDEVTFSFNGEEQDKIVRAP